MNLTPFDVEILLHYYGSSTEHRNADSPAGISALSDFVQKGLIIKRANGTHYGNMDALKPYVDALCAIPLPKQKWTV